MNGADQTVLVMLAVLVAVTVVIGGGLAVALAPFFKARSRARPHAGPAVALSDCSVPPLFDRPGRWLAIRCSNLEKVQAALGLHNPAPCLLSEGFSRIAERKLFLSPPFKGWIIVVGQALPDPADDIDQLYHFLMRTAAQLGSVQYYCANRVLSHHAWVRIENNRVYRAYAWAGEPLWNQGALTAAERALEMKCYAYGDNPLPFPFTSRDSHLSNTEKVLQLAARWSIDPLSIHHPGLKPAVGITGDLSTRS